MCDLHQTLREKSSEPLLADFEDIILNVIKDVKEQHDENARLHESFARLVIRKAAGIFINYFSPEHHTKRQCIIRYLALIE